MRFVQVLNHGQSWDHHGAILTALPDRCREVDQPCAALVIDLKQRGLLDTTVVHWGGEMGRLPVLQNDTGRDKWGRDHNTYGFSAGWPAAASKAGTSTARPTSGATTPSRTSSTTTTGTPRCSISSAWITQKLVYKRNGLDASLTDGQPARIVSEMLA